MRLLKQQKQKRTENNRISIFFSVLFFITPIFFFPKTQNPYLIKIFIAQFIVLCIGLISFILYIEKKITLHPPNKTTCLFILFLFSILLSFKNALYPTLVWNFFIEILSLTLLYYLSVQWIDPPKKEMIIKWIAYASFISGIYGLFQYFGIDFMPWKNVWGTRPFSTFGNPNFAAGWWIMVLPLFIVKIFEPKSSKKILWFFCTALGLCNLIWGQTRGAWAALIFSIAITFTHYFFIQKTKKFKSSTFYSIQITLIILLLTTSFFIVKKICIETQNRAVLERIFKWKTALAIIQDYPILGVGAGHLKVHFANYQAEIKKQTPIELSATSESNVHNEFLQLGSELGFLGAVTFLFIFIFWYFQWTHSLRQVEPVHKTSLASAAGIFAFLLFCLTNFPLHFPPTAYLLIFLIITTQNNELKKQTQLEQISNPKTAWRIGAIAVSFSYLYFYAYPLLYADYLRGQADQHQTQKNFFQAIQLYEKSIALDFYHSERAAYELGEAYRSLGQLQKAIESYQISIQIRHYGEVYNNIGNCYYLMKDFKQAIHYWKQAVLLGLPKNEDQILAEQNLKIIQESVLNNKLN